MRFSEFEHRFSLTLVSAPCIRPKKRADWQSSNNVHYTFCSAINPVRWRLMATLGLELISRGRWDFSEFEHRFSLTLVSAPCIRPKRRADWQSQNNIHYTFCSAINLVRWRLMATLGLELISGANLDFQSFNTDFHWHLSARRASERKSAQFGSL